MFSVLSWEAGQVLARKLMLGLVVDYQENKQLKLNPQFVHGLKSILCDSSLDKVHLFCLFLTDIGFFLMNIYF